MSRIFLRWSGGEGGDTIMSFISKKQDLFTNVNTQREVSGHGESVVGASYDSRYPTLKEIALKNKVSNKKELLHDIEKLCQDYKSFLCKFHVWDEKIDSAIQQKVEIVNVGFSIEFIPFIVKCNLLKTPSILSSKDPLSTYFDSDFVKLSNRLTLDQNKKLVTWSLIKDSIQRYNDYQLKNSPIQTQDLFYNLDGIVDFLKSKELPVQLDEKYIADWRSSNQKFLPSQKFVDLVDNQDFDYTSKSLDLVERYVLLALSDKNFQFLD